MEDFLVARNPQEESTLPFLLRLPLGPAGIVLKARETWPRTAKVYCHESGAWPAEPDIVERVPVRSCVRRGAAIDLVLNRGRENRSQFVFARARGRDVIFWQSARTLRQARPRVALPKRRASGHVPEILVDSYERYPWGFKAQQATTVRRALPAGDYGVESESRLVAVVERKSLADLVGTLTGGKLRYLLAALSDMPRAALVVEDRYSAIFKLTRVRPAVVAEGLAEAQVRFPTVPIVFCETRPLAQEWAYRFFGAALDHLTAEPAAAEREARLRFVAAADVGGGPDRPTSRRSARGSTRGAAGDGAPAGRSEATTAEVRAWARAAGLDVAAKGRLRPEIRAAYEAANGA